MLALDIGCGLGREGLARRLEPFGPGLARSAQPPCRGEDALDLRKPHLLEEPAGQSRALGREPDPGDLCPLGRRLHGLGEGGTIACHQHARQVGLLRLRGQALHRVALALGRGLWRRGLGTAVEEGVEYRLEPGHLVGGLGQGRAKGVAEQFPVGEAHDIHRAVGVDRLRRGDPDIRRPQGAEEVLERRLHRRIRLRPGG